MKQKTVILINTILLSILAILFISLFSSVAESLRFLSYFGFLFIGGFGLSLLFKNHLQNGTIHLILAFFMGIITNYVLFICFQFFNIKTTLAPFVLLAGGIALIFLNFTKAKMIISSVSIHKDRHLFLLIILIISSLFLFSDKLTYTTEGIYVHDPRHPTTELSFAQSVDTMFPINYLSYQGMEFKYHFGFGILAYQLVNQFHVDSLNLVYSLFPSFFVIMVLFLLYEYAKQFTSNIKSILFCFVVLFSTLSLPTDSITQLFNLLFHTNLSAPPNPYFLFAQFVKMGSFALAIIMTILLLILIEKKERNYLLETIILTGLAITKITFFIIAAMAYFSVFSLNFIAANKWKENWKEFLKKNMMLIPGAFYFVFFVAGTHAHNLWVIFPGSFNIESVTLSSTQLISNVVISLLAAVIIYLGIGLFYLIPTIKNILKEKKFIDKIKDYEGIMFSLAIILFSYGFGIFLTEITESNHKQFLFPGYILLTLLTYKFILTREKVKRYAAVLLILLVLINVFFIGILYTIPTVKLPYQYEDSANNPLAAAKLNLVKNNVHASLPLQADCLYSHDLIRGLQHLAKEPDGTFLMNVLHQNCENYNASSWEEIVSAKNGGFIRTAVTGKQTLAEHYKFKGILTEKDYCDRIYENIVFYSFITGDEKGINEKAALFENSPVPRYEDFSYYTYFKKFSTENYYTYNQQFEQCIIQKLNSTKGAEIDSGFLKGYIIKNGLKYILFEKGEKPLPPYEKELGLIKIYSSEDVTIYRVNSREATFLFPFILT
ncbi:hypothetical protein J4228_00610 [Candidatus Woesearchaeota archaeon]|nr:hypothetical protein [Candidatus Woesearchaeota archaeon]